MNSQSAYHRIVMLLGLLMLPALTLAGESTVDSVASNDGSMIYYEMAGEGAPALVFVHCWSCDRNYWREQIDRFSADHRVVAIDLAGHGESGLGRKAWTMAAYGSDVVAVLNKLDLYDVVLIGHSMGGLVVLEATRQAPERVQAIIGIDNFQDFTLKFPPEQIAAFLAPFDGDFESTTKAFVGSIVGPNTDSAVKSFIIEDMASAPPEVAVPSIGNVVGYDYTPILKDIHIPIRTISSSLRPTNVEKNRMLDPDFEVDFIEDVGHFPMLENPEMFDRVLARVIEEMTGDAKTAEAEE